MAESLRLSDPEDTFISSLDIKYAVDRLAAGYTEQYRYIDEVVAVNVRKGAGAFVWDLMRKIKHPNIIYTEIKTETMNGETGGDVTLVEDLEMDIEGRHLLIGEDILDRGLTLAKIVRIFKQRNPASLSVAVLFEKPTKRDPMASIDAPVSVGIQIADRFVVGNGLDYNEQYRHLGHLTECQRSPDGIFRPVVPIEPHLERNCSAF